MTIFCKKCNQLVTGPDAPMTILDREQRAAAEFGALYPFMAQHLHAEHKEEIPMLTTLIDQYALAIFSKWFSASDKLTYEEMMFRSRGAAWVTLCQTWNIFPGLELPTEGGGSVQKRPPDTAA